MLAVPELSPAGFPTHSGMPWVNVMLPVPIGAGLGHGWLTLTLWQQEAAIPQLLGCDPAILRQPIFPAGLSTPVASGDAYRALGSHLLSQAFSKTCAAWQGEPSPHFAGIPMCLF